MMARFAAFVVFCMLSAAPALAADDGYAGLIAPSDSSGPDSSANADSGYEGLITPMPDFSGKPPKNEQDEPAGYAGLIPGRTEEAPQPGYTPKEQPPQITSVPELQNSITPESSDDVKILATVYGQDRDGDGVPDDIIKPAKISKAVASSLGKPRKRIQDMLPMEYTAKSSIEKLMPGARNDKVPAAVRAENISKASQKLSMLAEGLRQKSAVPDRIYRQMGLSDVYISEEKEGNSKALSRLDKALRELRKYQSP